MQTINKNGIEQIHQFLTTHHKLGDNFDNEMLNAWANDAEFQLNEGNRASIEIRASDTVSGRTETFTISVEGLDEIEITENCKI